MEIRNRLVGALVIIAVGSIAWPILFHDSTEDEKIEFREVPSPPHFEKFVVTKPENMPEVKQPAEEAAGAEDAKTADSAESAEREQQADSIAESKPETEPANESTATEASVTSKVNDKRESDSVLDDRDLPISWIVQVASFESLENAENLRKALGDKGFPAYTQQVKTSKGRAVRVFVGPKLQRSKAESIKQQIDKEFKLDSMIKRFSDQ